MKAFALTFFILCSGCIFVESVNLNCAFKNEDWLVLGTVYTCNAHNQGDIINDSSNRDVTTIAGSTSTNPSVKAVNIYNSNCFYFPHGLQKFFTDLQVIWIYSSKLREIRRNDLKEYTNLRYLDLENNEIKFLEQNLFEFTPKLEFISLNYNKIAYIDANVFNNFVGKLSYLFLSDNICQFGYAFDKSEANQVIEKVQSGSCNDATLLPSTTTTTKTPITTTTTILTTTTPKPSISSAEFEALQKLIGDLINKIETQNSEIKDELKEVEDLNSEVKVELKEVKDELKTLKDEQNENKKKLDDQNLEMKSGFGNITAQNQQPGTSGGGNIVARLDFIEKQLARLHIQTNLP